MDRALAFCKDRSLRCAALLESRRSSSIESKFSGGLGGDSGALIQNTRSLRHNMSARRTNMFCTPIIGSLPGANIVNVPVVGVRVCEFSSDSLSDDLILCVEGIGTYSNITRTFCLISKLLERVLGDSSE